MWIFFSALKAAFELKRVCPKCKTSQSVSIAKKDKTVQCKRCGHDIPPPGKSSPKAKED